MRKWLFLLSVLILTTALAGCGNTETSNNGETPPVEIMLPEKTEDMEISGPVEIGVDFTDEEPYSCAVATWQKAYAALLRDYASMPLQEMESGWQFILHDINHDGVPELFLVMRFVTEHTDYRYAYTFVDNEVQRLNFEGFLTDGFIYAVTNDRPWIVAFLAVGSGGFYSRLALENGGIIPVVEGSAFMSELGHEAMWEDEDFDWQSYEWRDLIINGNEATVHEFEYAFGSLDERVFLELFDVNEGNIRRHIETQETTNQPAADMVIQAPESYIEWAIEELGATIEAAGAFWNDWWFGRGMFAPEHIACWGEGGVPEHLDGVYLRLLPTSGFESLNDIRNYLLQYFTESWVDVELSRDFAAFVEYDSVLYIHIARMCFGDRNWETAEHVLIEQDGSHAIVETTVLEWHGEVAAHYELQYRFTFIGGRIADTNMPLSQ